ncbi:class I SAM-dependent methyltransferase family protein [Actinomadura barringtoniae]|uniref:Class I SAM-dependent methyltransferase family protein n=1 Tax=Actinomadura barringtoniae TaxID=1427535 RepID=A0A939T362_9ACTN|nr:class I SAM-dependent methyltransferase family protein [Actinomadura barringtoniae]MBO2450666.1 class I SAM-dependent methyltransferase family protein [Actinomadura barringtoniae]
MRGDIKWAALRLLLSTVGRTARSIRIGYRHGFDSGTMLDYVYVNRAQGDLGIGRLIDRVHLDAIGWRAIRSRRDLLQDTLRAEMRQGPLRIMDVAAGPGRYLQELLLEDPSHQVLCRDLAPAGLRQGAAMAVTNGLTGRMTYQLDDAFDPEPPAFGAPDVIVVSGLYELILDDDVIKASMARLRGLLAPGGVLIFTTQVRHPQLELIANVLPNRDHRPWVMKCRPVEDLEKWALDAGFADVSSRQEQVGLFTVTSARTR